MRTASRVGIPALIAIFALQPTAAQEKVLLDTDSARFNDDGAALVMLLQEPNAIEIQGITIVSGNHLGPQGAEYMLHLLEIANRQIPLYLGAQRPLVNNPRRADIFQRQWGPVSFLGGFAQSNQIHPPHGGKFAQQRPQPEDAVSFLIRSIENQPHELTILAIGPLTNLAMALQLRPDLAARIKRLVFMGGNARVRGNITPFAEFNFWYDPEAARHVLHSDIPEKVMFGLDVTNQAPIGKSQFDQIAGIPTPITELFAWDMGNYWPGFYHDPEAKGYIWDCLAAAYLLDPSLFPTFELLPIEVNITFGPAYGATFVAREGASAPLIKVATGIDFDRFFQLYKKLLTRWPLPEK